MLMSISIIIPTYNYGRFITSALNSVFLQDYRPLEVIVIDDGSTDSTPDILRKATDWLLVQKNKYPEWYSGIELKVFQQDNAGPSAARNAGLQIATGNFIAFLDADDVFPAGRLTHMVRILDENSSIDMVFGLVQPVPDGADILNVDLADGVDANDNSQPKEFNWVDHDVQGPNRMLGIHSGVYRSQIVSKIGFFDESLRYYEDIDWLIRAERAECSMLFIDGVVLYHRKHEQSMTADAQGMIKGHLQYIRKLRTTNQIMPESFKRKWNFSKL
jgi:glycosyltransferase involved in cell wall biosynthesis